MINPGKLISIDEYIEIFLRRIWCIIIPLALALPAAAAYAFFCPKSYMSSTTILVTPQRVPVDYVRPTVTSGIEDRLLSISQEIMSRTRLEQIISEFKLYSEQAKTLTREEIVENMRKDIGIKIGGKEGFFSISYVGRDPKVVTMVTNKLASLYIEENLKLREQQAQGTTEFLSTELSATRAKLEQQEKEVTDFKKKYIYELPEQVGTNLTVLGQFQRDHQRISDTLKSTQDRKLIIQRQIAEMKLTASKLENLKEEAPQPTTSPVSTEPLAPSSRKAKSRGPVKIQIDQLKNYLTELQGKYTEMHPDVRITKKRIEDLEKMAAENNEAEENGIPSTRVEALGPGISNKEKSDDRLEGENLFSKEMEDQLAATEMEINKLKEEDSRMRSKIAAYQARIESAPARDLTMISLTREYNNTKENYENLLRKSQASQQAENLERRQKGEQFRVIDPARIPEKPFKPNIRMVFFVGFFLGIGPGVGITLFKEYMDRSFRNADDLETTIGVRVLANIPKIVSSEV